MSRTLQVDDIVEVIVNRQRYPLRIEKIGPEGISAPPYLIVPEGATWKVQGYQIPHEVIFRPSTFQEKLNSFLDEARRLSGQDITLKEGPRFISLEDGSGYIFARVDKETGDVYSQSGQKPRGNLLSSPYGGKELIDRWGVIVNAQKAQRRLQELQH